MRIKILTVALVALGTLVAVPAFADGARGGERGERPSFPIPAATFKQHVDAHTTKARARMEERASKLDANQAKELRAKFEAGVSAQNAEVGKAIADGSVTKDEAKAVRAAGPRGGHGGGGHCEGKKGAKS